MSAGDVTDAQVFDILHRLFGVGDFDGTDAQWPRWRMTEISKIKAYRSKRNVDPFELVEAAHYCRRREIWIKAHWQLYEHLPAVNRERLAQVQQARVADLEDAIQEAIEIEAANPDSPWVDRLIRAAGPARQEVYDAWSQWSSASPDHRGTATAAPTAGTASAPSGGRS